MAKIQLRTFKDDFGIVTLSNMVSSSVKNPHQTLITVNMDDKTWTYHVHRYIDLDTIDTYANVWAFLHSIKEELKQTSAEAQMYQNNKQFQAFVKEEIEAKVNLPQ